MSRGWIVLVAVGGVAAGLTMLGPEVALALRLAAVLVAVVPVGAVLMLAIALLTGAQWQAFAALTRLLPVAAVLMVVALTGTPVMAAAPLGAWQHPVAAALRSLVFFAGLILATGRLSDEGTTAAAITLALYTVVITPIATDWMLALPVHPVSAIGMMLAVQQIAGACAAALVLDLLDEARARDIAKLLVAAMLGLGYLGFVDYLVVWYGNLPERVPFYLAHSGGLTGGVACVALLAGIAGPIAALAWLPRKVGRRVAGGSALVAIVLFDDWWLGVTLLGFAVAAAITVPVGWTLIGRARHG